MRRASAAIFGRWQQRTDFALFHFAHRLAGRTAPLSVLVLTGSVCLGLVLTFAASAQKRVATPSTYGDAMRWYEKSAKAGSPQAQFLLGLKYESGAGSDADLRKAAEWFRRAAGGGHPLAQYRLAGALHEGRGIERNIGEAAAWYRRAAEAGIPEAAFNLAFILEKGLAGPVDPAGAAKWYLKAAEAGLGQAQFNLGVLYMEGRGVGRDPVEARIWFDCAAASGAPNAESYGRRVDGKLSAVQRSSARAAAERRCGPGDKR